MTAYYNEHDPGAAEWLRELIKAGLIAPGEVDERSIEDVTPNDVMGFTQCHWFAGIGGWSLALRQAGWPDTEPVWTGSCPCQPFSAAGKRKGTADERHLWPAFHWLISQCRPPVIFGEQVAREAGRQWFDIVSTDLESTGYACGACDLTAAGIGAPHIRQRLYWVAHTHHEGPQGWGVMPERAHEFLTGQGGVDNGMAHSLQSGRTEGWTSTGNGPATAPGSLNGMAHTTGTGSQRRGCVTSDKTGAIQRFERFCNAGALAHTASHGQCADESTGNRGTGKQLDRTGQGCHCCDDGAINGMAYATGAGPFPCTLSGVSGREESAGTRHGEPERFSADSNGPSPLNGYWRNADWLCCTDGKWRPIESGLKPLVNGVPGRVGLLRGYGNAIVVPLAKEFIETYLESVGG